MRGFTVVLVLGTTGVIGYGSYWGYNESRETLAQYRNIIANPELIMAKKKTGTTILDRNGIVLFQGYGATEKGNIKLADMPVSLLSATLATEDDEFYQHQGLSLKGTTRALYHDVLHTKTAQGGSTITQQLVKTTLLTSEKSFERKFRELVLSVELERRYSKDQILEMYLNSIYYGEGAYGVKAASEIYFHKPVSQLSASESALLAGLAQSPSQYNPNLNPSNAINRRDYVLERMNKLGMLGDKQYTTALATPVTTYSKETIVKAPHFVFYILDQLRRDYGQDIVEKGAITVHSTLDYNKQLLGEEVVRRQITSLNANHVTNGGLVSVEPKTGDIIAMVGSVDYNQAGFGNVNVTLSALQPGSSFKPITYLTAFQKGYTGATVLEDKPIKIPTGGGAFYEPKNFDEKNRGTLPLRRALANSLNIPAVHALEFAGIGDTVAMAHNLGISESTTSLSSVADIGLSMALGSREVRPLDMAGVYATIANNGVRNTPRAIAKVEDRLGDNITKPSTNVVAKQVIDSRLTYMITSILSDNGARREIFGARSPLELSRPAAVKSGTTNDYRDNWTIGFTPSLVTAVWVGNNDHSPMNGVTGIMGAAPIWKEYMERALADTPVEQFIRPAGLVQASICGGRDWVPAENLASSNCGAAKKPTAPVIPRAHLATNTPVGQQPIAQTPALPGFTPGRGGGPGGNPPPP